MVLFVSDRAWQWRQAGVYRRAIADMEAAAGLNRGNAGYARTVTRFVAEWVERLRDQGVLPTLEPPATAPVDRRWPAMPWELEWTVRALEAAEDGLHPAGL